MKSSQILYRIGEMADLLGISRKTLYHYEKIGLIQPVRIDAQTGYRYYSLNEFYQGLMVYSYKLMNFSLADIRRFLKCGDEKEVARFYLEKYRQTRQQIRKMKIYAGLLKNFLKQMRRGFQSLSSLEEIKPRKLSPRQILSVKGTGISQDPFRLKVYKNLIQSLAFYRKNPGLGVRSQGNNGLIFDFSYENPEDPIALFVRIQKIPGSGLPTPPGAIFRTIPGGLYLTSVFQGSYPKSIPLYQKMRTWMEEHRYQQNGPVIHSYLLRMAEVKSPEKVLTEIQIPIILK